MDCFWIVRHFEGDAWRGFFTKLLQVALFTKFRNSILGITEEECLKYKEDYYKAKANRESVTSNNSCGWEVTQECVVVSLQKP